MLIPRWSTIGLFVLIVIQFAMSWFQARRTRKTFRGAVLPNALMAGAFSIILVREFFADQPLWIDAPLVILCWLIILIVLGVGLVSLKRFLKEAWSLEHKNHK